MRLFLFNDEVQCICFIRELKLIELFSLIKFFLSMPPILMVLGEGERVWFLKSQQHWSSFHACLPMSNAIFCSVSLIIRETGREENGQKMKMQLMRFDSELSIILNGIMLCLLIFILIIQFKKPYIYYTYIENRY